MTATQRDGGNAMAEAEPGPSSTGSILFERGYKPFFIGAGLFAIFALVFWSAALNSGWGISAYLGTRGYHVHEMIFGYLAAVLAGYLLSEVPDWTGPRPVSGRDLVVLVALWLAGRVAMLVPLVPPMVAAAVDAAFLVTLAGIAWREARRQEDFEHVTICLTVTVFALANIAFHGERLIVGGTSWTERLALGLAALWIAFVGGEIVPRATEIWMREHAVTPPPAPFTVFDLACLSAAVIAVAGWVLFPFHTLTGVLFAGAAIMHFIRLARWRGLHTLAEPMVAVLHLGYLWLPLWFVLAAVAVLAPQAVDGSTALHALAAGGVGTMTVAVMVRAFLEHSGQPLEAGRAPLVVFALVIAGAVVRMAAALLPPDQYVAAISAAALLWVAGFAVFLAAYVPLCFKRAR